MVEGFLSKNKVIPYNPTLENERNGKDKDMLLSWLSTPIFPFFIKKLLNDFLVIKPELITPLSLEQHPVQAREPDLIW